MTPNQLKHLLTIVECGSLGQAAKKLNISEPALSRSLRELELELGVDLMDRTRRGMIPTIFGLSVSRHARTIRNVFDRVYDEVEELNGGSQGHISIGFNPSCATSFTADAIRRLYEKNPGIRISTREGFFEDLIPPLQRGELDLAIVTLRDRTPPPDLNQIVVKSDPVALVVRRDHPLAKKKGKLRLGDLVDEPWIMGRPGENIRSTLERRFNEAGLVSPRTVIDFTSIPFAKAMLASLDVLALMPVSVLHNEIDSGAIVVLPMKELEWARSSGLLHHAHTSLSPLVKAFIAEVKVAESAPGAAALRPVRKAPAKRRRR